MNEVVVESTMKFTHFNARVDDAHGATLSRTRSWISLYEAYFLLHTFGENRNIDVNSNFVSIISIALDRFDCSVDIDSYQVQHNKCKSGNQTQHFMHTLY